MDLFNQNIEPKPRAFEHIKLIDGDLLFMPNFLIIKIQNIGNSWFIKFDMFICHIFLLNL